MQETKKLAYCDYNHTVDRSGHSEARLVHAIVHMCTELTVSALNCDILYTFDSKVRKQ